MSHSLRGKVAIITGSTSGIGLGLAQSLAAEGADVMLNGFGDLVEIERLRKGLAATHGIRVIPNYKVMGPVKAALECAFRYLAFELGEKKIRVHAISPGLLKTRASSELKDFDRLLAEAAERAPLGELVDIMDVGFASYMATPYARRITGGTIYVGGGANIRA